MRLPPLPSTLLLGGLFLALGVALWVRPGLATAPLGDAAGASGGRRYWGRGVAVAWLLLGALFGCIGVWTVLYA
ncbi:hypothetical protein [Halorarius halobius]|uniref:hypothetical protein n=1 Tax=Halorarius halobius TaxID=2962671 RepID=UPI0020CDC198|nr:hypothetical protein [Halorarius halobius]